MRVVGSKAREVEGAHEVGPHTKEEKENGEWRMEKGERRAHSQRQS